MRGRGRAGRFAVALAFALVACGGTAKIPTATGPVTGGAGVPSPHVALARPSAPGLVEPAGAAIRPGAVSGAATGPLRATDVGITPTEIRIGASWALSGPAAVYGRGFISGADAWFKYVNARGGINGRQIRFIYYDDQLDPARMLSAAKRLVEVDKVFMLTLGFVVGWGEYVKQRRVPVVTVGNEDEAYTHPMFWPVAMSETRATHMIQRHVVRKMGAKKVAIIWTNAGVSNLSQAYADKLAKWWRAWGADVVESQPVAVDQTDCTSQILAIRAREPDFIHIAADALNAIKCLNAAREQQYKPRLGFGGYYLIVSAVPQAIGSFADGLLGIAANDNPQQCFKFPECADFVRFFQRLYPDINPFDTAAAVAPFVARMITDALQALGPNVTRERFIDYLNSLGGYDGFRSVYGDEPGRPIWSYHGATDHHPYDKLFLSQVVEGKWRRITGWIRWEPPPGESRRIG